MATKIISAIVPCLAVVSIILYSFIYFHYGKKNVKYKKVLFAFFITSGIISILSLIFVAIYKDFDSGFDAEILMNIETSFLIVIVLLAITFSIIWFWKSPDIVQIKKSKLLIAEKTVSITSRTIFYLTSLLLLIIWVVITIIGNYIKSREDVSTYLSGEFSFIAYIFLALFVVLLICLIANLVLKIILAVKEKIGPQFWIKMFTSSVGYVFVALGCMLVFLGIYYIDDIHNYFGRSLLSFTVEVYTNDFSYMLLYFDLIGIALISISYVRIKPNKIGK